MNQLISIRTNIFYSKEQKAKKDDKDLFKKQQELVFLVDKPTYRYSNEGEVIRERGLEEFRFCVSEKAFAQVIDLLTKLKDADESDLA
jgi:hypothetical protein